MHAYNVNQSGYDYNHSEFDEFDTQAVRFKPESLDNLVKLTKFDRRELKLMYRGFKQLCPSGVVKEDKFKLIYAQFFPRGAETNSYARFVFNSFDVQRKQEITFTDFVIGLSVLTRGTIDEQLRWIFTLYDINGDGIITRDELNRIVNSIHDLMGKFALNSNQTAALQSQQQQQQLTDSTTIDSHTQQTQSNKQSTTATNIINNICSKRSTNSIQLNSNNQQQTTTTTTKSNPNSMGTASIGSSFGLQTSPNINNSNDDQAESLFRKFDLNNDGIITLDEFLEACYKDENIIKSISVFNTIL